MVGDNAKNSEVYFVMNLILLLMDFKDICINEVFVVHITFFGKNRLSASRCIPHTAG